MGNSLDVLGNATRLEQAREFAGVANTRDLHALLTADDALDVSYETVRRYHTAARKPPVEYYVRMADVTGVSLDWMLTGRGEMVTPELDLDAKTDQVAGTPEADRVRLALQGRGTPLWLHDRLVESAGDGQAISYSYLQRFLRGDADLPDRAIADIASVLDVDADWLQRGGDQELGGKPTDWLNEQVKTTLFPMYLAGQHDIVQLFHMCLDRAVAALVAGPSVEEIAEIAKQLDELIDFPLRRLAHGPVGREQSGEFYTLQLLALLRAIPGRGTVPNAATLIERLTTDELPQLHFDLNA